MMTREEIEKIWGRPAVNIGTEEQPYYMPEMDEETKRAFIEQLKKGKQVHEFNPGEVELWCITFDGKIIKGLNHVGFSTKAGAKNSFTQSYKGFSREFGYASVKEMREDLEKQGRLKFIQIHL